MADVDRRGDDHDHAWAELTWRMLFGFVFKYGFIPGIFVGGVLVALAAWTNLYWVLLAGIGNFLLANPLLDVFGVGLLVLFIFVMVKIRPKPKKQVPMMIK